MVPNFLKYAKEHGWLVSSLQDLLSKGYILDHLDGNHGNLYPRQEEFVASGVKYISANSIVNGKIDFTKSKYLSQERADRFKKGVARNGDVIFAHNATVGPVALVESQDDKIILSTSLTYYRVNKNKVDGKYLVQYMSSSAFSRQYESIMRQTTRNQIPITTQREFLFAIPPLSEQNKIAKILSTWDRAITTIEQLLANSQQQKKALMQQLLTGKKRLLDKSGIKFSGEWKFKKINQIATRVQRKSDGNEHPILTISSLSGFVRQDERYSRYMAGESVKNYILLERSEFAYNKGNSKTYEFGCVFDLDGYEKGLVPHVYVCFKLKADLSHRYFKYLFEADYLKPQLGALVNTGVRNNGLLNIKPDAFMSTQVPVPCIEEQERIADVLHASSEQISQLQKKLDCLKMEKQALMQQLLTGKRRVKVEEVA